MPPSTIVTLLVFCFWLSSVRGRRKRVKKTTFFLLKNPYHWSVHPEPVIKSVNCHMTCTSDADFCAQRCLYGICSFECDAKRCNDGKCESARQEHKECLLVFPKVCLIIFVVLCGLMTGSSLGLLVSYTCGCDRCHKQYCYLKLESFSDSFESFDAETTFV